MMTIGCNSRRVLGWVLAAALLLGPGAGRLANAEVLNFRDAEIGEVIETIHRVTGKTFLIDPRVKGRVTLISRKDMEPDEIYEVFLSILAAHGFATVPGNNVIKIIPEAGAKQDDIPTVDQFGQAEDDQVVTQVIQVHNVSAAQIVPILRPLIPPQGHLAAYAPTNVLIVSDRAGNVERVANIIRRVDLASTEEVEIVPLRYASASEVVRVLTALEQGRARGEPTVPGGPTRLVADERTNSVLISGDSGDRLRLRTLIAHLDTPLEAIGNTQVIYLRYANAADLVAVLQGVSRQIAEAPAAQPQPQVQPQARIGGEVIDIQADEATNALVVTGPPEAIRTLRAVIAQLDVRRAQVLVEAVIAEISAEKQAELGIQWVIDGSRGNNVVGFTNFTLGTPLGSVIQGALDIADDTIPALPAGITALAGNLDSRIRFAALIRALATDSDSNVLSTPTLVTLDNEEAEIVVAENRAFLTGSFTTTADGADNPFQTIERRDVGLTLKVKPQINEGNAVKMEISQEVEDVIRETVQGPDTRKRSIKTTVMVEDGQVLVLGGLIDDQLNEAEQKVPGLGDIPLLGGLFRYRTARKEKNNLMVFLHPVILRDSSLGTLQTNAKYSYIRQQQFQAQQEGIPLLPGERTPVLPPPEEVQDQGSILDLRPDTRLNPLPAVPAQALNPNPPSFAERGFRLIR